MTERNLNPNELTVVGHLDELRRRIILCLIFLAAGTAAGFILAKDLITLIEVPSSGIINGFIVIRPAEIISVYVRVALFFGLLAGLPAIIYHVWRYVRPAVGPGPGFALSAWMSAAMLLFVSGVAFSYYVALPAAVKFLISMTSGVAEPMITLSGYVSFAVSVLLTGGIVFEMPAVSAFLTTLGIVTPKFLRSRRKEAFFGLCVVAAVMTPTTDIFNLALFVVPMAALYEVSIIVSRAVYRLSVNKSIREAYAGQN
ncbi:MAG: twin-arginine translocase subunit TatC [Endomicrobiales bacterium]|nr:twin-arginine translocase subunit TatC [Endomicrobiales bacterium]